MAPGCMYIIVALRQCDILEAVRSVIALRGRNILSIMIVSVNNPCALSLIDISNVGCCRRGAIVYEKRSQVLVCVLTRHARGHLKLRRIRNEGAARTMIETSEIEH